MKKGLIYLLFLALTCTSCGYFDPVSKAQRLARKGDFEEAIPILVKEQSKKPESVPLKSILAQIYSDYGLALCQDPDKPPSVKYPKAKEQFAMALVLNPYLTDAQDMHDMIEKIQNHLKENKLN